MTRTLTAGMVTAASAQFGEVFYLFELAFSGGTLRYTTAPNDMSWDGQTWTSIGGHLSFDSVQESRDLAAQSAQLTLDGVNQTIIAALLGGNYIGRVAKIYLGHFGTDGTITADPILIFSGYLNSAFRITETPNETCKVKTAVVSHLARFSQQRGIRATVTSHQAHYADDTFWRHISGIGMKQIWWGGRPVSTGGRGGRGSSGDPPDTPGDQDTDWNG